MESNETLPPNNVTTMLPSSDPTDDPFWTVTARRTILVALLVAAVFAAILCLVSKAMRKYLPKKLTPEHWVNFNVAMMLCSMAFTINAFYWCSLTFFFCNGVIFVFICHVLYLVGQNGKQNTFGLAPCSNLGWLRELVLIALLAISVFLIFYFKGVIRYSDFLGIFFHDFTYTFARLAWIFYRADEFILRKGRKRIGILKREGNEWIEVIDEKKNEVPDVVIIPNELPKKEPITVFH